MATIREFEKAVLGLMILTPEVSDYAFERLTSECFQDQAHRIIFRHVRDLWETCSAIDALSVSHRLESKGVLDKVGGHMYVVELADLAAIPSHLQHYVDQILEAKKCENLSRLGLEISQRAQRQETSAEIIAAVEAKLSQISTASSADSFSTLETLTMNDLQRSEAYPTGFLDLDRKIGGLPRGELWVLAGRPSVGKTALALNLAVNLAKHNIPIGFFSIEMSLPSLKRRIISSEAKLSHSDLEKEEALELNRERLEEAVKRLRGLPMYFDASAEQTPTIIKAKAHRLVRTCGIQIVFVDYLQLIQGPKTETREQEISAISAALKRLTKESSLSVVALCQLNRRCEERGDKKPLLADLRESGAIEQDADGVILLHRPELYGIKQFKDEEPTSGIVEATVAKNRNGETGVLRLTFRKKFTRFENYQKDQR